MVYSLGKLKHLDLGNLEQLKYAAQVAKLA
jgi:hypothetical protein